MPRVKVIGLNVTGSSRPAPWILPAISSPYAVAPIRFRCIVPERHRHLLIVRTRHPQAAGGPHCAVQARFPRPPPPPRGCASSMAGPSMGHAYAAYQYRMHDFRHHHLRPLRRCCWRRYAHAAATSATNRYRMCCRQTLWSASAKLAVSHEPSLRIRRFSRCRSCFGPAPGQEHIKCWTRHVHFQPEQVNRAIWAFVITVLVSMLVLAVSSRTARP